MNRNLFNGLKRTQPDQWLRGFYENRTDLPIAVVAALMLTLAIAQVTR
jgi:hypothetical protein